MNEWRDERMDRWRNKRMNGGMVEWMDGLTDK